MSRNLTRDVGLLSVGRVAGQMLNALVGLAVVRYLTQEHYGTFRQAFLIYTTMVGIGALGLFESIYYFVPTFPDHRKEIVRRAALFVGAVQIAVGVLMPVLAERIGHFFQNPALVRMIGLLAVTIGVTTLARAWEIQLVAEHRVPQASALILGFEVLKSTLMGVALILHLGVMGLIWALAIAGTLKAAAYIHSLRRTSAPAATAETSMPRFGSQLWYSLALWVPGVLAFAATQAHQYIVGHYYKPEEYAVYAVACFQVPFINTFAASITEVFLVHATDFWARKQVPELYQLWMGTCKKAMLLFMPLAIGMAVLAKPMITVLFTPRYQAAAPLFSVIVLSLILNGIFQDSMFRACASMKIYSTFHISRGLLAVLLAFVGVRYFGLWGAALSMPVALTIINIAQLFPVARLLEVGFLQVLPWGSLGKILLASVLAGGAARLAAAPIDWQLGALTAGLAAYTLAFGCLVLAFGEVTVSQVMGLLRRTGEDMRHSMALRAKAN